MKACRAAISNTKKGKIMQTYIANCTQQRQIINYKLPESRKVTSYTIPMGKQLNVGDLTTPEMKAIEAQLGPYGLRSVDDISRSRQKITYLYSTGKPVSAADIVRALDQNRGILSVEGKHRREQSAVAANSNMNTEETPLNRLEMSVEEETSGSEPSDDPIGEGFKIDNTLSTSENKRPRRSGRRK